MSMSMEWKCRAWAATNMDYHVVGVGIVASSYFCADPGSTTTGEHMMAFANLNPPAAVSENLASQAFPIQEAVRGTAGTAATGNV